MADRREALKIIGAVGSTCAFPFAADELYAQHAHPAPAQAPRPDKPTFFSPTEYAVVSRLAGLIIPRTDTPGAIDAGVPAYIDFVVGKNPAMQKVFGAGLERLDRLARSQHGRAFLELAEPAQSELLAPLCVAADRGSQAADATFFRDVKSLTADGYYTSRAGLIEELGYRGNTVLAEFPGCVHEH